MTVFFLIALAFADDRSETLALLQKQNYFRSATCREIANSFLKDYGLPALGTTAPVPKRGDFDRGGDAGDLPTFSDSRTGEVRIRAERVKSEWRLTVEHDTLRSEITFTPRRGTPPACVTRSASFRSGKVIAFENLTPAQCLEFFLAKVAPERLRRDVDEKGYEAMRKDCAIALRFVKPEQLK